MEMGIVQRRSRVVSNRAIARDHFQLSLYAPEISKKTRPGQFVHIRCTPEQDATFPLLRRPFSIYDADPKRGTFDLIYKVVGTGTESLRDVVAGQELDVLGPLGTQFTVPSGLKRAILVGGGVGIPPLYFWGKDLKRRKFIVDAFLGVQTKDYLICADAFQKAKITTHISTDDGSVGFRGFVTEAIEQQFRRHPPTPGTALYICGPTPMMKAATKLAERWSLPAQVSLEERMGCAMGVCMGCIVEIAGPHATAHKKYQRVCTEGPVFPAEAVVWR
ncbi:MAG: dihydroorotate dehydrogenase electron transfer subunit [Candidatus Omnitrophica bacterium]|nr:dihydroorotate dehydrogenase electron transfer subunit [Candidatus Omnitrophota bacterium]